jgi:catechol 2,3-dioxygenase-like lactoylglutathione lyase family enzyme
MRLQHVSITAPGGGEERVRAFYGGLLGLKELDVPPKLDPSRLIWFRVGEPDLELHVMLGEEAAAGRGHFCLEVEDVDGMRRRLADAGVETSDATEIVGRPRFFCRDPFGNRVELTTILEGR